MTADIFNKNNFLKSRNRYATKFIQSDFIHNEVFENLIARFSSSSRIFDKALIHGAYDGRICDLIPKDKINQIYLAEQSSKFIEKINHKNILQTDFENLSISKDSLDLIISPLILHKLNNIQSVFQQFKQVLKKDGLIVGAIFGGKTLQNLRNAFMEAELELQIAPSPHIYPFIHIKDMGRLLQNLNFSMPVVDSEIIEVEYSNLMNLFNDLRIMNEANYLCNSSKKPLRKDLIEKLMEKLTVNDIISVKFEIIYFVCVR